MSNADLAERFSQLADEELSFRVASGGLTEQAHEIAVAELKKRGLRVPEALIEQNSTSEEYLGDMVILERNLTPTEAHLLCSCLHSAGVEADAGDTNIVQAHSLLAIAVGGASVRVPSAQLAEAREVVAAFRRGEFELGDDFDPNETAA